jgi:two-component system response regulator MtrA
MKILIADHDKESIENTKFALSSYQPDWHLSIINSGKECLDIVKNGNHPDVIILGMQLEDMSGLDLIKQIRDDSNVPVIVLSQDKDIRTLVEFFDAGANDYIVKPFNKAIFVALLKAAARRMKWNIQPGE